MIACYINLSVIGDLDFSKEMLFVKQIMLNIMIIPHMVKNPYPLIGN